MEENGEIEVVDAPVDSDEIVESTGISKEELVSDHNLADEYLKKCGEAGGVNVLDMIKYIDTLEISSIRKLMMAISLCQYCDRRYYEAKRDDGAPEELKELISKLKNLRGHRYPPLPTSKDVSDASEMPMYS